MTSHNMSLWMLQLKMKAFWKLMWIQNQLWRRIFLKKFQANLADKEEEIGGIKEKTRNNTSKGKCITRPKLPYDEYLLNQQRHFLKRLIFVNKLDMFLIVEPCINSLKSNQNLFAMNERANLLPNMYPLQLLPIRTSLVSQQSMLLLTT